MDRNSEGDCAKGLLRNRVGFSAGDLNNLSLTVNSSGAGCGKYKVVVFGELMREAAAAKGTISGKIRSAL